MNSNLRIVKVLAILAVALLAGCSTGTDKVGGDSGGNVLLAEWTGPYGGVPAFDKMDLEALEPAVDVAMARSLEEIDTIAQNSEPPTFENTIVALEKTGDDLDRVMSYWGIWRANLSTPEFREIQGAVVPKLAEFRTKISQNQALFQRIKAVYEGAELDALRPDQKRLTWLVYNGFARNGATLEGESKERYGAIAKELAGLQTRFADNILADEEGYVLYLNKDQLGGLPDSFVQAAAAGAADRDREGEYAVTNTRSSMDPFLTYSNQRDLREKVWRTYYSRGDNGDEHDNNSIIPEILKLRNERVQLLGYDNYAQWRLENRMAKTPENAMALMEAVWPAALARVKEEVADMQALADQQKAGITIEPWDYRYYAEKVRKAKYDLDSDLVAQYFQLDKLQDAMHFVAGELFNFKFTPVEAGSVPVFQEDVVVYEVTDKTTGEMIGLWYLDALARPGKRSGAWATSYRDQDALRGKLPILASNNCNFIQGTPGEPILVSFSDAETFFHEFGHALHYLSSTVAYPTLNGGVRDYTEFQSQLLERWLLTDEVIDKYLVHYKTGEPIPDDLVAKIRKAATFNSGFETTEYLASALMDMQYHTIDPAGLDVDAFERKALAALNMPDEIVMRHRSPHFGHIFSSEGYSTGYYGYMWADVLTADAAEAFADAPGGYYDQELAKSLVANLFTVRNAVDPADAYRTFRGRDATIDALMRDKGFPVP